MIVNVASRRGGCVRFWRMGIQLNCTPLFLFRFWSNVHVSSMPTLFPVTRRRTEFFLLVACIRNARNTASPEADDKLAKNRTDVHVQIRW